MMTTLTAEATCTYPGCPRPIKALTLCDSHYVQQRRHRRLTPLRERHSGPNHDAYLAAELAWILPYDTATSAAHRLGYTVETLLGRLRRAGHASIALDLERRYLGRQ